MNVKKPERPSCSNLTERQWKNIVDSIEYDWDTGTGAETISGQIRIQQRDISTLMCFSLICPLEDNILSDYIKSCADEYSHTVIQRYKDAGIDMPIKMEVSK